MYKLKMKKSYRNIRVLGKLFFVKLKYLFYLIINRYLFDFYDVNFLKNYILNVLKFFWYRFSFNLLIWYFIWRFGCFFWKEVCILYWCYVFCRKGGGWKRV